MADFKISKVDEKLAPVNAEKRNFYSDRSSEVEQLLIRLLLRKNEKYKHFGG
jgi:hypothetical protein